MIWGNKLDPHREHAGRGWDTSYGKRTRQYARQGLKLAGAPWGVRLCWRLEDMWEQIKATFCR